MTMECVASVLAHKGALHIEVIIVDNCSADGSAEALRAAFPDIMVIDSPANGGFAYGNNIGFEQSHGRYMLLLNPDTRVYAGGLETAIAYMDAHRQVGILGPRVLLDNGTQQSSMLRYLRLTHFFFIIFIPSLWLRKSSLLGDMRYAALSRDEINVVDAVSGCFMLARRAIFETVGGLDQRFFMYGEESEWARRVTRAGHEIHYNPAVEILHHGAASTAHLSEWKSVEMTKGHILFLRFTRGAFIAWVGTLLMLVRDLVRVPYYVAKALAKGGRMEGSVSPWWVRLKFLMRAIISQPKGQSIKRPRPPRP